MVDPEKLQDRVDLHHYLGSKQVEFETECRLHMI